MFTAKQLQRYADVLWWGLTTARPSPFKKNDIVVIRYSSPAVKLAEILYAKLLDRGIHPVLRINSTPAMEINFYLLKNSWPWIKAPTKWENFP